VVQGFSQDYRIHQGTPCVVIAVQLLQVLSGKRKGGYLPVIERNTGQIAATAQKECSLEYVCGLVMGHGITSLIARWLSLGRRCGRR